MATIQISSALPALPSDWSAEKDFKPVSTLSAPTSRAIEPVGPHFLAHARRKRHSRTFSEDEKIQAAQGNTGADAASRSEEEWRHCLLPQAYRVLREHGTERPGSSPLNGEKRAGTYHCAGCGNPLFDSVTKFESVMPPDTFWIAEPALYFCRAGLKGGVMIRNEPA